ncbi:hypothetical protein [Flavobacterium cerinum]|uniref:Uncharacterized protein n=1 Tax=Flavobacterium cerinum TaxID=2502784 RepID=A0A444HFV1_9FLAO|nr:hypothetical protein [Flavobacterium cerinum]RWX03841.1 hypothetical protein EPI11_02605 [Flavobacterium cerinum]
MINFKKIFYLILLLNLFCGNNLFSQYNALEALENQINNECKNCNQGDLNVYLVEKCSKTDSLVNILADSLERSIERKFAKNKDANFKNKMNILLKHTVKDLISIRSNIVKEYSSLNEESAENEYFIYLLHLYWSNRITDMLHYYIDTVEKN